MSEYPVHESLKVLKGKDVYRTDKWIKAVLKTEAFGRTQVCCYQWINDKGKWKRKQKMCAKNKEELDKIYSAMSEFLGE